MKQQNSNIENYMVYVSFVLQFSIWKTATILAINNAVIHNFEFHFSMPGGEK